MACYTCFCGVYRGFERACGLGVSGFVFQNSGLEVSVLLYRFRMQGLRFNFSGVIGFGCPGSGFLSS